MPEDEIDLRDADTWPAFLTVEEAAKVLRISPNQLRKLLREGLVAGQRIGDQWRINKNALLSGEATAQHKRSSAHERKQDT